MQSTIYNFISSIGARLNRVVYFCIGLPRNRIWLSIILTLVAAVISLSTYAAVYHQEKIEDIRQTTADLLPGRIAQSNDGSIEGSDKKPALGSDKTQEVKKPTSSNTGATPKSNPESVPGVAPSSTPPPDAAPTPNPPAVPTSKTYYVSTSGNDNNSGLSLDQAFKTPGKAVSVTVAGDTVRFAAGTYTRLGSDKAALNIQDKQGAAGKPITFTAVVGHEKQAIFKSTDTNTQSAIIVRNSSHIVVENLRANTADSILQVLESNNVIIRNNDVHASGQLGIAVRAPVVFAGDDSCTVTGGVSSYVVIEGNRVYDTGYKNNDFAEGIYLGQGCANGGDKSHDIVVRNNEIFQTKSEAIEVKIGIYNTVISGNYIHDINPQSFGAITVNAARDGAPISDMPSGNFVIENNTIDGVTSRRSHGAGIWIAHGNGIVRNNIVKNIHSYHGIVLSADFGNPSARYVEVTGNTISNFSLEAIKQLDGIPGGTIGDYYIHDNIY